MFNFRYHAIENFICYVIVDGFDLTILLFIFKLNFMLEIATY